MINCRRPSNRSSRLALPFGPSNSYSFSTASHGIRRRSAASASRARVNSFSFTSSCWRAASHSCGDTILERFICFFSTSISCTFICVSSDFCFFIPSKKLTQDERQSSTGRRTGGRQRHGCYAYRTHGVRFFLSSPCYFFLGPRAGDQAILPRTCDTLLPTQQRA